MYSRNPSKSLSYNKEHHDNHFSLACMIMMVHVYIAHIYFENVAFMVLSSYMWPQKVVSSTHCCCVKIRRVFSLQEKMWIFSFNHATSHLWMLLVILYDNTYRSGSIIRTHVRKIRTHDAHVPSLKWNTTSDPLIYCHTPNTPPGVTGGIRGMALDSWIRVSMSFIEKHK